MANISKEIKAFKEAMYGEEIRGSMISLANNVNEEVEKGTEAIRAYGEAEGDRVKAEEARQENEAMRVAAEDGREEEFGRLRQAAEAATLSANGAAASAAEAKTEAIKATNSATEAARAAGTAAESAAEATTEANEAAGKANEIAGSLEEKLEAGEFTGTVRVGNVTTGKPGTEASVRNTGTEENAVLDFVIPQGLTGSVENIDTVTVEFQQAATRENIESSETFRGMFGKIKKWFADLGTAAFRAVVNNLTTTEAGYVLDARQGKILSDQIAQLNRKAILFESTSGLQDGDAFTISAPCWEFKFLIFKLFGSSVFLTASMPYYQSSPGNIYGTVNAAGDLSIGVFSIFVYAGSDGKAMEIRNIRRALVRESGITMSAAGDYKLHRVYGIK